MITQYVTTSDYCRVYRALKSLITSLQNIDTYNFKIVRATYSVVIITNRFSYEHCFNDIYRVNEASPTPTSLSKIIAQTLHDNSEGVMPDHPKPDSPKGLAPAQRVAVYLRKLDRQRKSADSIVDSQSIVPTQRAFRSTSGMN